jgi:2-methylcitrate dehydratase PrpD
MQISEKIAKFTLNTKPHDIPDIVVSHAKLLLLDTIGVAMLSHDLPHARIIEDLVTEMGGKPDATLWGSQYRGQLSNVLLYNSALIHGVDFDDTHVAGIVHPSASVVATAITVGEYVKALPRDILTAIIVGWEILVALAVSAKGRFHDIGYHASGLLSSFASACVAARLMGDSEETLCDALGICGSQAAALQEFLHDGSWTKKIHPGWGCHSAYYALMLARRGYKGPKAVFEGDFGLYKTHTGTIEGLNERINELSRIWRTVEITFKLYPVCHFTHSFIDCALLLRRKHGIIPANIDRIICRIDSRGYSIVCDPLEKKRQPDSDYLMRFSLPYVVAVALAKGRFSSWDIDMALANDPEIKELMQRVDCVMDEKVKNEGHFPGYLDIITNNGDKHHLHILYEKGTKENPITEEDVMLKFENNLLNLYPENRIKVIKKLILDFENIKSISILINELNF